MGVFCQNIILLLWDIGMIAQVKYIKVTSKNSNHPLEKLPKYSKI